MPHRNINRVATIVPVAMSLAALVLALVAVATGWGQGRKDEGAAAHLFQLLIALQLPFFVAFLVTADWTRFARVAGIVALQAGAAALAFGPVAFFRL